MHNELINNRTKAGVGWGQFYFLPNLIFWDKKCSSLKNIKAKITLPNLA